MKKIKKMLAIVLLVALFTLIVPLGSINLTANALEEKDFRCGWNGGVEINGLSNDISIDAETGELIIPLSIDGNPVKSIGEYAFEGRTEIASVVIPNGVELIRFIAFKDCTELESISIPKTLTTMGKKVFSGCTSLEKIIFSDSVANIGGSHFLDCPIKEIHIKDISAWCQMSNIDSSFSSSIEKFYINGELFSGELVVPDGVICIRENTFSGFQMLKSITLPDSVTKIEKNAFSECTNLRKVNIGKGITELDETTFKNSRIETLTITKNLKIIKPNSFENCTIKKVVFEGTRSEWGNISYSKDIVFANAEIVCSDDQIQADKPSEEKPAEENAPKEENITATETVIVEETDKGDVMNILYIIAAAVGVLIIGTVILVVFLLRKPKKVNKETQTKAKLKTEDSAEENLD